MKDERDKIFTPKLEIIYNEEVKVNGERVAISEKCLEPFCHAHCKLNICNIRTDCGGNCNHDCPYEGWRCKFDERDNEETEI